MPGHHARRRDDDVAGAQPEPLWIGKRGHRLQHPVQVEERLAHAHEDDVGQSSAPGRQPARGVADLVEDLRRLEVAPEARARRWRRTGSRRRNRPGSRCTACGALDARAGRRRLGRGPGSASAPTRSARRRTSRWSVFSVRPLSATVTSSAAIVSTRNALSRPARKRRRKREQLVAVAAALLAPDAVADLPGAVRGLALAGQPAFELALGQAAQPWTRVGRMAGRARLRRRRGHGRGRRRRGLGEIGGARVAGADGSVTGGDYRTRRTRRP